MYEFKRPTILVSKCLGFEACRYNGQMAKDDFVNNLKNYVEFITVCPEVEIGLETPRECIRIVKEKDNIKLIQPKTGKDYTEVMFEFSNEFLNSIEEVDGFILKSRSPSCGTKDVKMYTGIEKGSSSSKGKGIFGGVVIEKFTNAAIEDEGRLRDFNIREHFLTKIFILRDFRYVKNLKSIEEIINFHKRNKLLFSMYNRRQFKNLNSVLENKKQKKVSEILREYEEYLKLILARNARYTSKVSTLKECYEYFSKYLSQEEKKFTVETIEKYKNGHIPYNVPLYLLKSYAVRFNDKNIISQSLFNPYPEELVEMRDSGKALI
ncbi:YbgA family protein [Clostridium ganghwense]|uniref:DUF523 and DUF1722 domain-containing protein n=1 Tax=Clostridium ganghwense TaxID=312089 RepID=A0ABT4CT94_9CLOT|nr:DUF523 and DUF1722 domain-containing protein [Clostridium ganghwense]MCY6372300.1 DUF523 and DUF1722 domain-containing protein [Clostridium ganghwense]